MLFKEVKVGMSFLIRNEDTNEWQNGEVTSITDHQGYVTLQFNDANGTYTWGLPGAELHDFIKPLRG
jgi:hypothetical protein